MTLTQTHVRAEAPAQWSWDRLGLRCSLQELLPALVASPHFLASVQRVAVGWATGGLPGAAFDGLAGFSPLCRVSRRARGVMFHLCNRIQKLSTVFPQSGSCLPTKLVEAACLSRGGTHSFSQWSKKSGRGHCGCLFAWPVSITMWAGPRGSNSSQHLPLLQHSRPAVYRPARLPVMEQQTLLIARTPRPGQVKESRAFDLIGRSRLI